MSSNSVCRSCVRALQQFGRRSRWIPASSRRCFVSKDPFSTRQSSSYASTVRTQDDHYDLTGKSPSLNIKEDGTSDLSRLLVQNDDLFHPLSESPIPQMRQRAAFIKAHAYCPHPSHNRTRTATSDLDPEARKPLSGGLPPAHVNFECPHCGIPAACSEEHWAEDYEEHMKYCDVLREINEDDHDMRSGRQFFEFNYPERGIEEAALNFTNWDTLLYTREFSAINEERSLRHATKLLTYPMTIGSILHELSPYNIRGGGKLTPEGLRSLTALRYNLHPPRRGEGSSMRSLRPDPPPVRLFVIGARGESSLPREAWIQLAYLFHRVQFHIILIGPESMINRDEDFPLPERTARNPFGAVIEDDVSREMKLSTYVEYFHTLYEAQHFAPFDPYFDCFMLFHPGLGHPSSSHEWEKTVSQLLETKCPILVTGYTEMDMQRDISWLTKQVGGEMDILLEPGENRFRSLKWDMNDLDPQDISAGNWGVWAFRGKRYEAQKREKVD